MKGGPKAMNQLSPASSSRSILHQENAKWRRQGLPWHPIQQNPRNIDDVETSWKPYLKGIQGVFDFRGSVNKITAKSKPIDCSFKLGYHVKLSKVSGHDGRSEAGSPSEELIEKTNFCPAAAISRYADAACDHPSRQHQPAAFRTYLFN
jgi:hypothetical protein